MEFRRRLDALGLSQAGFAVTVRVSPNTVSRWLNRGPIPGYALTILELLEERRDVSERLRGPWRK